MKTKSWWLKTCGKLFSLLKFFFLRWLFLFFLLTRERIIFHCRCLILNLFFFIHISFFLFLFPKRRKYLRNEFEFSVSHKGTYHRLFILKAESWKMTKVASQIGRKQHIFMICASCGENFVVKFLKWSERKLYL